jgi:hypothetical protein
LRKFITILLLTVHLFNLTGYTILFQYCMDKSDEAITAQIDSNNYKDNDLLEVKVPLNMPYVINSDFERVDGRMEYQGVHYDYVKRKVSNDTLYLLCLPNKGKTALAIAKSDYTKAVNDIPANKKDASSSVKKGGLNWEYNRIITLYQSNNNIVSVKKEYCFISTKPAFVFIPSPAQPPELA